MLNRHDCARRRQWQTPAHTDAFVTLEKAGRWRRWCNVITWPPGIQKAEDRIVNHKTQSLSNAELLAAPESEYMSEDQLFSFKQRLLAEAAALHVAAEATNLHLLDTEAAPDPADRASAEEEHSLELRVRDRERKLLRKITQALQRIDNGTYGWCEETGEPIGIARLLARPTASLSLAAQERHEQRKRQFGG